MKKHVGVAAFALLACAAVVSATWVSAEEGGAAKKEEAKTASITYKIEGMT